ncbi:AAA family ATPase, partial [bacterium]|nr:AAA family ATPase [bacterium]
MALLNICIGAEQFKEIRENDYCYVDKTSFIEEMFRTAPPKVSLITRPRRFGKTLTMTMLQEFFDIRQDSRSIFEGLTVSRNTELCEKWMNQYPTVFLTLKGIEGQNFKESLILVREAAVRLCGDNAFLLESQRVPHGNRALLQRIIERTAEPAELAVFLQVFCNALKAHWGKPAILLIDEYDVPISCAEQNGYYKEMVGFMRSFLGAALKTNASLKFAVLTGCLRIAKESIFTGLNNFMCYTVSDVDFADKFGFTEAEVDGLLAAAGLTDKKADFKEWYDGYRFGNKTEIYCPWDILMHLVKLQKNPQ